MSIVGPRPLAVQYLPYYTEEEQHRHDVRPGLSGLAQVNGRNAVNWEEKFAYDVEYVNKITFLGDVQSVLKQWMPELKEEGNSGKKKRYRKLSRQMEADSAKGRQEHHEGQLPQDHSSAQLSDNGTITKPASLLNLHHLQSAVLQVRNSRGLTQCRYSGG